MYSRNYIHRSNILGAGLLAFLAGAITWALFGRRIKEKVNESEKFSDLKRQVYDKASEVSNITREKYDQIIDEVTDKYAQVRGISKNEVRDLVDDLKWHFRRIKSSWNNNRYSDFRE